MTTSIERSAKELAGIGRGGFSGSRAEGQKKKPKTQRTESTAQVTSKVDKSKSLSRITFSIYDEVNGLVKDVASMLTVRARNAGHKATIHRDMLTRCSLSHVDSFPWEKSTTPLTTEDEINDFIKLHLAQSTAQRSSKSEV